MEKTLVLRAKAGDRAACESIARIYLKRVYATAYRILRNVDDAADIAQETFIRAFASISTFDESRPLYPWLARIAKNLALNTTRRSEYGTAELPDDDLMRGVGLSPDEAAERAEQLSSIRRAIDSLNGPFREIIVLKHFEDCSYAEIADILGIPIGTVMSRLYNARRALHDRLQRIEEGT
ncbi:MAG: sigma-70 family RNA polymerase sigma factor [Spirochaetaceae bacterium]|nr:MAG: sigma-70 family RNA polymerase sigma factor [Spirochaetaceae bacterium]